ncbi:ribonuclease H-like domain-containing protein [Tanacetum coccineum]
MSIFLDTMGVVAYTPQQNEIAERKHRHLLNVVRILMFQGGIPLSFWPECVLTAVYLINRLPSSVLNGKSPFYLVYGREPNLSHLRSFGCLCYAGIVKESDKFSSRSEKCVLIGYAGGKKAYKLFSLESRNVLYSRDVKFYETVFPYKMGSIKTGSENEIVSDVSSLNFFDFVESETTPKTLSPNDEEEGTSGRDGGMHQPDVESDGFGGNPDQQPVTSQAGYDGEHTATPVEENTLSEGNIIPSLEVPVFQNGSEVQTEENFNSSTILNQQY